MHRKEKKYITINYEEAKLTSEGIYEIAPGGLRENTDRSKLTIITLLGNKTLSEVDSETGVAKNITTVTILDVSGKEMDIKKGYKYQTGYKRQKNYVVGRKVVDKGDLDENAIVEYKDVAVIVVIIELATGDVRAELGEAKAQIFELNTTVDVLLVINLEE